MDKEKDLVHNMLCLSVIERLDEQGFPGALLIDLSKAFHTINHELLTAKLHEYGFYLKRLKLY